jgi:hypothetical protein
MGSGKVIAMIAEDIVKLRREFYPEIEKRGFGQIVWQTTTESEKKPSYGKKAEDYKIKTVVLPLVNQRRYRKKDKDFIWG